jgi:hypothetical protein
MAAFVDDLLCDDRGGWSGVWGNSSFHQDSKLVFDRSRLSHWVGASFKRGLERWAQNVNATDESLSAFAGLPKAATTELGAIAGEEVSEGFKSFFCLVPEGDEHEGLENPAEKTRPGGKVQFIRRGGSPGGVFVPDAGDEGLEKGRGVNHFDGGDFPGLEGEVFGFDPDDAKQGFANAEGGGSFLNGLVAPGETGFAKESVPLEAAIVVVQESEDLQ